MSEEQSLKSEKKSESEASVPGEKTEERGGGGEEEEVLLLHNVSSVGAQLPTHRTCCITKYRYWNDADYQ